MLQARVYISGRVQGIGYRYFVKSWARTYRIAGWVRNLPDGGVEGVFQGERSGIENLIVKCKDGPFLAEVKDVEVKWEEAKEEFGDFKVN